jgi:Bacterial Ig-like domain (group 3)/Bacterial Ig-like domain (group 1)
VFSASPIYRLAPAAALLVACGGGDLVLPGTGEPAAIRVIHGDGQSGRVGAALADSVVALVTDDQSRPVAGAAVVFALPGGTDASVAPDTALTGNAGEAAFRVTLGTHVGTLSAQVAVSTANGAQTLTAPVSLTAVSADANGIAAVSGDGQSAPAGADLPDRLMVQVTDGFGNPIPGVAITWAVEGGGNVSDQTTMTGDDGLSSVLRTLGPVAGTQHTLASALGLVGSPVDFAATATAGAAAVLEMVSGDGQSAVVGTSLPAPLVVRAHDADGNAVSGLAVAWVVRLGGGSLAPETSVTDADGRASTLWTLGPTEGQNTAAAVVSGVGTVNFSATANPGTPPSLAVATQPPGAAVRGVGLSADPVIQLQEPDGSIRRKQGVNVTVALIPGGAELRGQVTRATNADGRATFAGLALEGPPGTYALAFAATGYTGVTSTTIALSRAGTTTTILSDDPDPSTAGQPVRVRFRVQSPGGQPDGVVTVTSDDGASCSAAVAAGECSLSLETTGGRVLTATYGGSAEFEGSQGTRPHTVEEPQPVQTTTRITADDPDPSDPGQVVTVRFTVTATSGTPSGTVTVTASSGGESCSASVTDGVCNLSLSQPGELTLTASYAGEGGFAGSSDTVFHTVRTPPPPPSVPSATASTVRVKDATIRLNHHTDVSVVVRDADGKTLDGIAVTLSATGDGNTINPSSATTDGKGEAKFSFESSVAGTKTVTATAGDVTLAEQPTITVEQSQTRTSITSDLPDPSAPGEPVVVGFAVTSDDGTPTGDVAVTASSGETCTGPAPSGSCSLVPSAAGSITITATYAGDGNFTGSSAQVSHVVAVPAPPVLAMRSQPSSTAVPDRPFDHQPEIQLRDAGGRDLKQAGVTVFAGLASGTGTLSGTTSVVTNADGRAAFTDLAIDGAAGSYTLGFSAAGFAGVESEPIVLSVAPTSTAIVANQPDPSVPGQVVTVQFAVRGDGGTPTGTVTVSSDGGESCTAQVGDGACTITFTSAGTFTLTAAYAGDTTFGPSTSAPASQAVAEPTPPRVSIGAAATSAAARDGG